MKLYEYMDLMYGNSRLEIVDSDWDFDTEILIDNADDNIIALAKVIEIDVILETGVDINLGETIEDNLDKLKEAGIVKAEDKTKDIIALINNIMNDLDIFDGEKDTTIIGDIAKVIGDK